MEYTIIETTTFQNGQINEINYEIEESIKENVLFGITRRSERRTRVYSTTITRAQYNRLSRQQSDALSFDDFVFVLRPFMMGFYQDSELEMAFSILDKDGSGLVNVDELSIFLPIINEHATGETLKKFIEKIDLDANNNMDFDEFRSLILKGIGRDILCNSS